MSALAIPMEPLVLMSQLPRPDDVPESRQGKLPVDPESSFALVLRARTGDEAAIEQLFSRYSIRLRRWAHGRAWRCAPGCSAQGDRNRHRPVVDQVHLHVGAEHAGRHVAVALARITQRGIKQRTSLSWRRGGREAGAVAT